MSIIIYRRVVHTIIIGVCPQIYTSEGCPHNYYRSMSINIYISEGCPQTNKYLCFENDISYMANCMCERVGEDSRHGTGHVDIQVGICMIYLNVCLVAIE